MSRVLRPFARTAVRGVAFVLIGAAGALWRIARGSGETDCADEVERILVIRLDLMGDLLFSLPLAEGLRSRYPRAHIALLTLPYTAPLVEGFPSVDEVVVVDTNRIRRPAGLLSGATWREYFRTWQHLRRRRFDLCVSVTGRMASLCAALVGARRSVGYAGEEYPFMLTDPLHGSRYEERKHEVEYVRRLALHAGAPDAPARLSLPVSDAARERVRRMLAEEGIREDAPLVLMHAGSINGSAKRWPVGHWSRFADAVCQASGATVVLVGAAGDRVIAQQVQAGASTGILSLAGKTDIPDLVALIARADLLATGDSGPLHLAVALGTPLLAVYGPTDPAIYGPYQPHGPVRVHRRDIACSPCYTAAAVADCPLGNPICMEMVSVEEMVASALELLRLHKDHSPHPGANTSFL